MYRSMVLPLLLAAAPENFTKINYLLYLLT